MAIIYTYTKVTPQPVDSMVITDVSDKNFTKTALIGEAVNESIAAGTNICLGWDSNTGITTINSASYSFEGAYEPFYWQTKLEKDLCGVVSTVDILKFLITPVNGTDEISTGEPLSYDPSNPDVWNLTQFAYGGGGNVGYVPAGGNAGEYLDGGTGLWTTLPADQNTTYDLSSIQNVNDSDIKLVGSDGTTDIVKLVAGTNITLTDTGSNITIEAATGGYSWDVTDGTNVSTVSNAEVVQFVGSGGITVTNGAGTSPYVVTIDGSGAGGGTVTSVSTSSSVNALSLTTVNPTTTPAVTLSTSGGSTGQYLDNTGNWSTPPSGGCANAVGSFNVTAGTAVDVVACGMAVTFTSSDGTIEIEGNNTTKALDLTIKEIPCASNVANGGIKVDPNAFEGTVERVSDGLAYPVQTTLDCQGVVRIPDTSPIIGTFEPVIVSRGQDGLTPLALHPDVSSITQAIGRYRISGGLAYIEFFVEFTGINGQYLRNTLGISVAGEDPGTAGGLETLTGLANLPTNNKMNACVTIADCGLSLVSDISGSESWQRPVVGGKLNKFIDPVRLESVIWLMRGGSITSLGDIGVRKSPTWSSDISVANDAWLQYSSDEGNPYIAGSLTVSLT